MPFGFEKSNVAPLKRAASPRVDCRSLFPAERAWSPTENKPRRHDQLFKGARKTTQDVVLHRAPLPLVWVLVLDNVIPDYAVPFSEAYGGPQFVARAFLEGHHCIGKAGTGLPLGALVTYEGRQLTVKRYEVLCFATEMRWNITCERQHYQQSSVVVSNTTKRSYNALLSCQIETTASVLLNNDILRVVPDDYATSTERFSSDTPRCTTPLSPISRHVIDDMCSSEIQRAKTPVQFAQSTPLSMSLPYSEHDVANESFPASPRSHVLQGRPCSPKVFHDIGQVDQGVRTARIHGGNRTDQTLSEGDLETRRAQPLSAMLPARLTSSRSTEATLERQNNGGHLHSPSIATRPLSRHGHFSPSQPFYDPASPTSGVSSSTDKARSIEHIRRNHQDAESEYPGGLTRSIISSAARTSSPLPGGRLRPSLSLSGQRHSSLPPGSVKNSSSFSATPASPTVELNRIEGTTQHFVGRGSHDTKPHARPGPWDASAKIPPMHGTPPPWSVGPSQANLKADAEDRDASTVFGVSMHAMTQDSGSRRTQGHGNAVVGESNSSVSSESPATTSVRYLHQSKGDKPQAACSLPALVPLTPASPSNRCHELPGASRSRKIPLGVSVEGRSTSFGHRQPSSSSTAGSVLTAALGSAALVAAVASSDNDRPRVLSPSLVIADSKKGNVAMPRRGAAGTRDEDQRLSNMTRINKPMAVASPRRAQPERVEFDECVSKDAQLDFVADDSRSMVAKDRGRARSPTRPHIFSPKPYAPPGVAGRKDVQEIERSAVRSSHGDMVQVQSSRTEDRFDTSREAGQESRPCDDTRATDVTMARIGFHAHADVETKASDSLRSDGRVYEAQEKPFMAGTLAPSLPGRLSQVKKDREPSRIEPPRKMTMVNSVYVASLEHPQVPPYDAGSRLRKPEPQPLRPEDANPGLDEASRPTAANTRQKYQVPLSRYLESERDTNASLVKMTESRDDFRQRSDEIRPRRDTIEDQKHASVVHDAQGRAKVTETATDHDSAKATSSHRGDSVVSALLATAAVAAVAYEAVAESRQKDKERTKTKMEARDEVSRGRDSSVAVTPVGIVEGNEVLEEDVSVAHVTQQSVVVGPSSTPASVVATPGEIKIARRSSEERSVLETRKREELADHVDSRPDASGLDARTTESTEIAIVSEGVVSARQTTSTEERAVPSSLTRVESQGTAQVGERWENDVLERETRATQSVASDERKTDVSVADDSSQRVSLNVEVVVGQTSDASTQRATGRKEQVVEESSKREAERPWAQHPTSSQESTVVVVAPQVQVNVQETDTSVTAVNMDAVQSTAFASQRRTEKSSEVETLDLREDTTSSGSRTGAMRENESNRSVETSVVESRQVSTVAGALISSSGVEAADARSSARETETSAITGQPAPIPIAPEEQSSIAVRDASLFVDSEQTVVVTAETSNIANIGPSRSRSGAMQKDDSIRSVETSVVESSTEDIEISTIPALIPIAPTEQSDIVVRDTSLSVDSDQTVVATTESSSISKFEGVRSDDRAERVDGAKRTRARSRSASRESETLLEVDSVAMAVLHQTTATSTSGDYGSKQVSAVVITDKERDASGEERLERSEDVGRIRETLDEERFEVERVDEEGNLARRTPMPASSTPCAPRSPPRTIEGDRTTGSVARTKEHVLHAEKIGVQELDRTRVEVEESSTPRAPCSPPLTIEDDKTTESVARTDERALRTEQIAVQELEGTQVELQETQLSHERFKVDSSSDQQVEALGGASLRQESLRMPSPDSSTRATSENTSTDAEVDLALQQNDAGMVDERVDSAVLSVAAEFHTHTEDQREAQRNTVGVPIASSEERSEVAESSFIGNEEETRSARAITLDETASSSYSADVDVESHHGHSDYSVDNEHTAEARTSVAHVTAANGEETYVESVQEEDRHVGEFEVDLRSVVEQDFAARRVEADAAPRATSEVSATSAKTSHTAVDSAVEVAGAVTLVVAATELVKEFTSGDTSSTAVAQRHVESRSEKPTTRTREDYDGHQQAREQETVSLATEDIVSRSSSTDKSDASILLHGALRQLSSGSGQDVEQLDQTTTQQEVVSHVDAETKSESTSYEQHLQESSQTLQNTAQMSSASDSTVLEGNARRSATTESVHLEMESHITGVQNQQRSTNLQSDLQRSPVHSPLFDSRPITRSQTPQAESRYSSGRVSPAQVNASPADLSESEDGAAATQTHEIQSIVTEQDVEVEGHASTFHTDKSSMLTVERDEPQNRQEVSDLRVAYPPPLPTGELSVGEGADQAAVETRPLSSVLATEEKVQVTHTSEVQDDLFKAHAGIPDSEEPPSYQDAVSDEKLVQPGDGLKVDAKSVERFTRYSENRGSGTLNAASNEVRSEEEASNVTCSRDESDVETSDGSISLHVEAEKSLGTHQEISTEVVSSASMTDGDATVVQPAGAVVAGRASSTFEFNIARSQIDASAPSPSRPASSEIHVTLTGNSFEDSVGSQRYQERFSRNKIVTEFTKSSAIRMSASAVGYRISRRHTIGGFSSRLDDQDASAVEMGKKRNIRRSVSIDCPRSVRRGGRLFSIHTHSMEHWMRLRMTRVFEVLLRDAGRILVRHEYMKSISTLAMTTWRLDVLFASRRASIVLGWGGLALARTVSLRIRPAHFMDHKLFINNRPQTIVRTSSQHPPVVAMIASIIGQPFDHEALVARILSCVEFYSDVLQEICLLCVFPQMTWEAEPALHDALYAIADILSLRWFEIQSVHVEDIDMGYWINVTVQNSFWSEQHEHEGQLLHADQTDYEHSEQHDVEEASSSESGDAVVPPAD